ncbi:hypothetical protein PF005_g33741 [Phytophthora fragariae]|nr:hypothetical protein PF003_g39837 [Phytophthora fragariae]KAE8875998.1 hypothetical protein PF003_g39835 [Phytophthora fragariae]KAE8875999.1 hypothetical protein PF003_g39832 [Phytophthora fragariae]KAE8876013.1 hypothetical protein PF003_g39840 [Phytophthora fragariae]KAE9055684.1 hypothetical protein PF006_g32889 [Phytophthora fragariae]
MNSRLRTRRSRCLPYSALVTPIRTSALAGPLGQQCSPQGVYPSRVHHHPNVTHP